MTAATNPRRERPTVKLAIESARALMLAAQGLLTRPTFLATKDEVLATIRRMGALQIDTINVVARSPYLVLWSRLGAYEPRWLDELLADGSLFEYWSHAACFLPIEDYPIYRHRMLEGWTHARAWLGEHAEDADRALERIREHGLARSSDFQRTDGRKGGWWNWKPEKRALEYLFATGELMIARRDANFQRVYDLRERVLPSHDDSRSLPREEAQRALVLKAVRALGVARPRWVPDYFRTPRPGIASTMASLAEEGRLAEVLVEGLVGPAYVHPDGLAIAEAAVSGAIRPELTTLLSPFDPLVCDRARVLELFGFDYRIEIYTPSHLRRHGYYSLPILRRGALIGRLDAKAHRKDGVFEIRSVHLEEGVAPTDDLIADLGTAIQNCAAWHRTPVVVVRDSEPAWLTDALTTPR